MLVTCGGCGNEFEAKRKTAKYCDATCRSRGNRGAGDIPEIPSGLVDRTRAELVRLKKLETVDGEQALIIATRMTSSYETGTAISALSKDLSRLMSALGRGAGAADPVDEMRERRERKARQASG